MRKTPSLFWPHTDAASSPNPAELKKLSATFHDSTNISYFFTAVWIFFRHSSHWNITHTLHKLSANVKYSVLPKVVEGNSCMYTQLLRGRGISPRWRPGVHFQPVSACVTSASGSACTALTRWERWRWFNPSHISINNSKSFQRYFVSGIKLPYMFWVFFCHLQSDDPSQSTRRLNLVLSEISFLFYWASHYISLCLLSITRYPQEEMKVSPPGNNPSKHVTSQTLFITSVVSCLF